MAFRSSSSLTPGGVNGAAVPVPTGAASGDIAVVGIYIEDTVTITPPSGFTLKSDLRTSATTRGGLVVYWKRLTGADSGTYSFTWSGTPWRGAVCGLWSGRVASGDPFDGTVGTAESTTTVSTLNVSTSPTGANGDAVGIWTNFNGGTSWTAPTNYTERVDTNVITLDTRDAVASGSTGNVTATSTITDFEKAFLGVLAIASSGITGTATPMEANDTSSASGQLGYSGTSARTEAADTSSATGTVVNPVTGTATVTQANQTASASGQLGYSGTSARTQANQTSTGSGQLGYSGTAAVAQAAQTASASGTFTAGGSFAGTVAVTQAGQTSTASGQLGYSGTSARTQAANTSTASGTVINPVTGTATPVQANQFSTANGILRYSGTITATEALDVLTAAGVVGGPTAGSVAVVQANQTVIAVGNFAPLVSLGTASGAVGPVPTASPGTGSAARASAAVAVGASASAASGSAARASSGVMTVPKATGG